MRTVKKPAQDQWVVLYIERWLVISPLLANLFLHYALDLPRELRAFA